MSQIGNLALAKGHELQLEVVYKPLLGYFIGTVLEKDGHSIPFTRESIEIWETKSEAELAFSTNNWDQSLFCDLDTSY